MFQSPAGLGYNSAVQPEGKVVWGVGGGGVLEHYLSIGEPLWI